MPFQTPLPIDKLAGLIHTGERRSPEPGWYPVRIVASSEKVRQGRVFWELEFATADGQIHEQDFLILSASADDLTWRRLSLARLSMIAKVSGVEELTDHPQFVGACLLIKLVDFEKDDGEVRTDVKVAYREADTHTVFGEEAVDTVTEAFDTLRSMELGSRTNVADNELPAFEVGESSTESGL